MGCKVMQKAIKNELLTFIICDYGVEKKIKKTSLHSI
jgi:hypothetical protein